MDKFDKILQILRRNDEIAQKFHQIEIKILSILDFKDLFEVLLAEIIDKFKVPYAWISIIENNEVSLLIQSAENSELLKRRMNFVDRGIFFKLVGNQGQPVLINENLDAYFPLFPPKGKNMIKSVALAPISMEGGIIGSLNQADTSPWRFQPGIDTSLLEQLALKVSLCLTNVTAHEKLKFLAYRDPLTGLLNRRIMESALNREFLRTTRYKKILSVVFIDIDDFKKVNDNHGHDGGDALLKYVADKLIDMTRDTDVVSRYAGDEFVVILPESSPKSTKNLMERLQTFFSENPLDFSGSKIKFSISFGIASTEDQRTRSADALLKKADKMLYQAKTANKSHQ
ncbi:MAG: sensor domain-containing diguanylate cyclase [Desulfobacterales bacterium]|nr:sensor domain-containing diguanylate cyclase [Desulfobacterales bacterium]